MDPSRPLLEQPTGTELGEPDLRRLLETQPVIEQAKGVLMGYYGIEPERAFRVLSSWSSDRGTKLRDLCAVLVERVVSHPRRDLPGGLQALLDDDGPA